LQLHSTVQGTPDIGIMDEPSPFPSTISPVIPYFRYIGKARQRRTYTSTSRTGSGFSFTVTRPSLVNRASTGALFTLRRDAPTVLPNPMISSPYRSSDLDDEVRSGAAPTPAPEEG
jgi:hypothetical protein